jgi:hypothetical protein
MRLAPEELEEIAAAADGNVSEFVRTAALEKARRRAVGTDHSLSSEQLTRIGAAYEQLGRELGLGDERLAPRRRAAGKRQAASGSL